MSTGLELLEDTDAASEARLCGAIEITVTLCDGELMSGLLLRAFKTSVCDCRVMRTDSAEVIQPLCDNMSEVQTGRWKKNIPTRQTVVQTDLSCF